MRAPHIKAMSAVAEYLKTQQSIEDEGGSHERIYAGIGVGTQSHLTEHFGQEWEVTLPSIVVDCPSATPSASSTSRNTWECEIVIMIDHEAHDNTAADHARLVDEVVNLIYAVPSATGEFSLPAALTSATFEGIDLARGPISYATVNDNIWRSSVSFTLICNT